MATLTVELALVDRGFWLRWILATAAGFAIGGAASGTLVLAAEYRFADVTSPVIGATALASANAVALGLCGFTLGFAQWIILRQAVARPGTWVVATAAGWAAAGMVSGVFGGAFGGALTGVGPDYGFVGVAAAFSAVIAFLVLPGLSQWLLLRRRVERAGWWVPAQALSLLAGIAVAFPIMVVVGRAIGWQFPSAQAWGVGGAMAGLIDGAIAGAVLLRLLRQRLQGADQAVEAAA